MLGWILASTMTDLLHKTDIKYHDSFKIQEFLFVKTCSLFTPAKHA